MKILVASLLLVAMSVTSQGQPGPPPDGCPTVTEDKCTTNEQCQDEVSGTRGRCNMEKQLCCDVSADGGLQDPTKCRSTETDCRNHEDCKSSFDKAECRAGKCCAYDMESEALDSPCPGFESDDEWTFGQCSSLTSCSETTTCGSNEACCLAGSCGTACLPDLTQCIDLTKILSTVFADDSCLELFNSLVSEGATFTTYCRSLVTGLGCVSEVVIPGPFNAMCKERMLKYMKANAGTVFKTIQTMLQMMGQTFNVNEEYVKMTHTCTGLQDIDDDDDKTSETGAAWNTSCPKLDHAGGLCPNDCDMSTGCSVENEVCCSTGSDQCHTCIPDLKQCANIERILGSRAATTCVVPKLATILRHDDRDDFCGGIWDMFTCSAETIVGSEYAKSCLERIAMILKQAPERFIHKIQTLTTNLQQLVNLRKFARDLVTECKESPFYEKPSRPAPDDVKACSNVETILKNSEQCNRIPATSLTNAACDQLKTFVTCLANRIVAGEDEHKKRKCIGELYKVIEENNQRLNFLRGFSSRSCEERENVCGDDLKPLDNVNCTTAACPKNYECTNSYCCPIKKEGWCPNQERGSASICKEKCRMDSDCEDDEKCCMSEACGYKTCIQKETQKVNKSKCDIEYENGRKMLERSGICRDGTSVTKLPNCQNTRFSPMQIDIWTGQGYCVTEEGKKIRGSDFMGNRDCTKVREGKCPMVPQKCTNAEKIENMCLSNDLKCEVGEKCCLTETDGLCVRMCVKAEEAPEDVPDECPDRKCCPVTLCQDKKCPADITAVCRINSCGECKAEFYNLTGKVNCFEGVTLCRRNRAEAQEENAKRRKTDSDRIVSFLNSRDRIEKEKERNMENKTMADDEMQDEDSFDDEYGDRRNDEDSLIDDMERDGEDEDDEDYASVKEYVNYRVCELFQKLNICKNGGQCKFGNGESFYEFCQCPAQYYGLLCEQTGSVLPQDTQCYRDTFRMKSLHSILMSRDYPTERMVIKHALNKLKFPQMVMPKYSCDEETGNYKQIQMGVLVNTDDKLEILYCVDTTTGLRLEGTPVTLAMSRHQPNCDLTSVMPDPLRLPRRCLAPKMAECVDPDSCQFFWNQTSGTCEKGEAGHGFGTVTACYNHCGMRRECVQDETETEADSEKEECEMKVILGPKPCRMTYNNVETDGCDYTKQFCNVEEDTTGQIGTCKDFPQYCLDLPHRGYGDKRIHAYFFNVMTGKCEKFVYAGNGGNKNRFYSLHQCKTECSTRPYKFDDIVCPVPRKLAMSRIDKMPVDKCDNDYHCHENQVCCSDDKVRVCTDPVHNCLSVRCSFNGACEQGKCVCGDCSTAAKAEVCGSDGKTYASECHLKRESCQSMRNITVVSTGPCSRCGETYCKSYETCENNACVASCPEFCTAQYLPVCGKGVLSGEYRSFSNECDMKMQACTLMEKFIQVKNECCSSQDASQSCMLPYCTREYNPLCAYDTTESVPQLRNYTNPCEFKYDKMKGRKVEVLYPGVCSTECGSTHCEMMQTCINKTCSCQEACTKEYKPICAHPIGDASKLRTFSNLCTMRREACLNSQTYAIFGHGPCKEPEPVYECPTNVREREGSAEITCNIDINAGCDTSMGEMCCPYGAGHTCLSKRSLVRQNKTKSGICPELFMLNYDESLCNMDECTSDGDCEGDAKCCNNDVCGHMTCVEPSVKNDREVCGANARIVSKCNSDMKETGCPNGGTCTDSLDGDVEIGVCCIANDRQVTERELVNSKLCHLLEMSGHTCQNGGTCVADLQNKTICQCMNGYHGHFCTERNPPEKADTLCMVKKTVMMALNKTGLIKPQLSLRNFLRSIDEEDDEENAEEDGEEDAIVYNEPIEEWIDPFLESVFHLIKTMGMTGIPQSFENLCTSDGHFRKERCLWDPRSNLRHCLCVFSDTGLPIPNGPKVMSIEDLMCDELTENLTRQDFCLLERPNMDICGDSMVERFYFNSKTMDCEVFTDHGCNENVKNNFVSYETCNSTCGAKRNSMSVCSRESCEDGKICRVRDGKKECVDPDSVDSIFEPVCDATGKFRPKQCHGEVCVCVNPDTGKTIANSEAEAHNLQCVEEGGTVKPVRQRAKKCKGNEDATFCPNGGDVCDNCNLRESKGNDRGSDRVVNDDNVCINCESCSADRGNSKCKVPEQYCQNTCQQFPGAECSFNTCTCKEEYKANNRVVNCDAVQSQCQIEQHKAKQEERANTLKNRGKQPEDSKQILCTSSGAYEAECKGKVCHCLNATDGTKIGNTQFTPDNINCESTQRKTKAERLDLKFVFPTKEKWSELSNSKRQQIITKLDAKMVKKNLEVLSRKFSDGSIIVVYEVGLCSTCGGIAETTDLPSLGNSIVTEVNTGNFVLDIEGGPLVASTASITDVVTEEELYGPVTEEVPEEDDDNKTTIIIVVVVVVVVVLLAVGIACYCYQKANKSKEKDIPFSDIQGQHNPGYDKA